jgi:hypothetical protein
MTAKRIEIFVVVVIIALFGIIYAFTQKPVMAPTTQISQNQNQNIVPNPEPPIQPNIQPPAPSPTPQVPANVIQYKGQDGKNAFELLKASHRVDAKHYSFGDMVTGIDGVSPDSKHFWAMYVNGEFSQVGASQYITKNSETIKWVIEEIKY